MKNITAFAEVYKHLKVFFSLEIIMFFFSEQKGEDQTTSCFLMLTVIVMSMSMR